MELGEVDTALANLQRAAAIYEVSYGPESTYLAHLLINMGQPDSAQAHLIRARTILSQALPENHPALAQNSQVYGHLLVARGQPEDAKNYFAQALRIRELTLGGAHPHTAESRQAWRQLGVTDFHSSRHTVYAD